MATATKHAVEFDAINVLAHRENGHSGVVTKWRFRCLCGTVGLFRPTREDAEQDGADHRAVRRPRRKRPPTPRLPRGPR